MSGPQAGPPAADRVTVTRRIAAPAHAILLLLLLLLLLLPP